jgi:predicted DNA-binding transcriptional regulator AlpA
MQDDDELLTIGQACRILGGSEKPIDRATYYRGVKRGDYPAPVHPSPGLSRIPKRELLEARARIINRSTDVVAA